MRKNEKGGKRMDIQERIRRMLPADTRKITRVVATQIPTSKQRICGYLSWMKRSGQIQIETLIPKKLSIAK